MRCSQPVRTVLTIGDIGASLAARIHSRADLGRVKLGDAGAGHDGFISGQSIRRQADVHLVAKPSLHRSRFRRTEERVKLVYRVKIEIDNPQP